MNEPAGSYDHLSNGQLIRLSGALDAEPEILLMAADIYESFDGRQVKPRSANRHWQKADGLFRRAAREFEKRGLLEKASDAWQGAGNVNWYQANKALSCKDSRREQRALDCFTEASRCFLRAIRIAPPGESLDAALQGLAELMAQIFNAGKCGTSGLLSPDGGRQFLVGLARGVLDPGDPA